MTRKGNVIKVKTVQQNSGKTTDNSKTRQAATKRNQPVSQSVKMQYILMKLIHSTGVSGYLCSQNGACLH